MEFRLLRADEIDARVSTVSEKGCSILLYKDARCDMNILDETVGAMNWKRSHSRNNANCTVEIWDSEKAQWISKEDVGTESNTEAVKGLASDSFKRACFNWGIGRELYTAPFIWFNAGEVKLYERNGKKSTSDRFKVVNIIYDDSRRIKAVAIMNTKNKTVKEFFNDSQDDSKPIGKRKAEKLKKTIEGAGKHVDSVMEYYKVKDLADLTGYQYTDCINLLKKANK